MRLDYSNILPVALLSASAVTVCGACFWSATALSPAPDEPRHLAAGLNHWETGHFDAYCVNPPLFRLWVTFPLFITKVSGAAASQNAVYSPAFRTECHLGRELIRRYGIQTCHYVSLARLSQLPVALLGLAVIFAWSSELGDKATGVASACLLATCPFFLSVAPLLTPDLFATVFGLLANYVYWRWLKRRDPLRAIAAGVCLGLALSCKSTWLILVPLWPAIAFCFSHGTTQTMRSLLHIIVIWTTAVIVLDGVYGFDGVGRQAGSFNFGSAALTGGCMNWVRQNIISRVPVPLPWHFLMGIDFQMQEFELGYISYFCGTFQQGGWLGYYLLCMLFKFPIAFFPLLVCSLVKWKVDKHDYWCVLVSIPIILIAVVSSQTGFNHHVRYVVPAVPYIYIAASQMLMNSGVRTKLLFSCLVLCCAFSTFSSMPNGLSHFNELAGRRSGAYRYFGCAEADSTLDWGQNLLMLQQWSDSHGATPFSGIAYDDASEFLEVAGFTANAPPSDVSQFPPSDPNRVLRCGPLPGRYAVGIKGLHSVNGRFRYFLSFKPESVIGGTLFVFTLNESQANEYRLAVGLPRI